MRMGRGQVRTLLADNTGKVFRRMGEGCGRAATGDARGVADEEARSRKATEGICGKVTSGLFAPSPVPSYLKIAPRSRCVRDRSSAIYQIIR